MPRNKWQLKYDDAKPMAHNKSSFKMEVMAIQSHLKKQEKSYVNNLILNLKQVEKEQTKPKVSRRNEITKTREEINKIEIKKTIAKIDETLDKPLARYSKKKKEEDSNQ